MPSGENATLLVLRKWLSPPTFSWFGPNGSLVSKSTFRYDDKGNEIEKENYNPDDSLSSKSTSAYDGNNWLVRFDTYSTDGKLFNQHAIKNDLAVMRGPIVLALDNRMVKNENYNLWLLPSGTKWNFKDELGGLKYVLPSPVKTADSPQQYIDLIPSASKPSNVWMAFEVPFLFKYIHFFDHKQINLVMCDYASAGNKYSEKNLFRVWLPQQLFMNNIFHENTWQILASPRQKRPEIPSK